MITDNDVNKIKKKLENSFATKDEFKELSKEVQVIKKDLKELKDDVGGLKNTVATKVSTKEDIKALSEDIRIVINMIGESLGQNKEQDNILDNHERRLDKVEDKVFSTN